MGSTRSSSGAVELPDFSSVPDLTESEKRRIRSYAGLERAGRAVAAEDLLDDSDLDSVWVGGYALQYTTQRLRRLIDSAKDAGLKRYLEERSRCLLDAGKSGIVPARPATTAGRYTGAYALRGSVICRNLSNMTETCHDVTSLAPAMPSHVSPARGTLGRPGFEGKENEHHYDDTGEIEPWAVLGSDHDQVCSSYLPSSMLLQDSLSRQNAHNSQADTGLVMLQGVEDTSVCSPLCFVSYAPDVPTGLFNSCTVTISSRCVKTLGRGRCLADRVADILMYNAGRLLRARTGAEVRVVPSGTFKEWTDWASRKPGAVVPRTTRLASQEPPSSLSNASLRGAEFVLLAWQDGLHYSTVVICNAGVENPLWIGRHP